LTLEPVTNNLIKELLKLRFNTVITESITIALLKNKEVLCKILPIFKEKQKLKKGQIELLHKKLS
jgi:hypothetical protein